MSRKPRLTIEPAVPEGTAFEGAFTAPTTPPSVPPDTEKPAAKDSVEAKKASKPVKPKQAKTPTPKPVRRPEAPGPGDDAYEQIVQGNWNVPAWMRAKVRAAAEESGASQNDFVQAALAQHIETTEGERGGGFALESRHFGRAQGGR